MNHIIDRSQALNAISDDDVSRASLKADIPRLKRRARVLNRAILYATVSGIATSLLVIMAFVCAFFNLQHEYGVAVLFVVALGFFTMALIALAREGRIALSGMDQSKWATVGMPLISAYWHDSDFRGCPLWAPLSGA